MGEREQITYIQIRITRMFTDARGISLADAVRALDASETF